MLLNTKSQLLKEPFFFFPVESVLSFLEQESSIYWSTKTVELELLSLLASV